MTESLSIGYRQIADMILAGKTAEIPNGWRQGRTAYGGITAGLCLAAAKRDFPDLPPLRTMQTTFVGPVPTSPVFETQRLRQGKNVTSILVIARGEDSICATAVCMFGTARESVIAQTLGAPSLPDPESCDAFIPIQAKPFVPVFFHQFETRLIDGAPPMTGAKRAYNRCWSRHKDIASRNGIDAFMALGDVLPPAAAPTFKKMGPISSMNWQMNILVDDIDSEDGWYQVETNQTAAKDGYSSQPMRFWDRGGRLVAEGFQSVSIFV